MTFQSCVISGSVGGHESILYRKSNGKYFLLIPVSIGFPIETALMTGCGSRYLQTLKFHNFLIRKYFFDRSKNK